MSSILDLGALRRQVADQLLAMKLVAEEKALCSSACDTAGPMRRALIAIRERATEMHAQALREAEGASVVEGLVIAGRAVSALKLEKLAAAGVRAADRRLAEMESDAAKPIEPGLAMSARKMGGWR